MSLNERPIPGPALRDEAAVEMLRVWIAERGLHCSLKVGMFRDMGVDEPRAWGKMLADAARHVAAATSETLAVDSSAALDALRKAFIDELAKPTSPISGSFVSSGDRSGQP